MREPRSQLAMSRRAPTLLSLCMQQVAKNLVAYAAGLQALPLEVAEMVFYGVLAKESSTQGQLIVELQLLCEVFWRPGEICLSDVGGVNCAGLFCLGVAGKALKRLDLSGCSWLDTLYFLPGLSRLRCLSLRSCDNLPMDCLVAIKALPQLECLDLEDVASITDYTAAYHIPGMSALRSLNVSGTGAADQLVEALTYGSRLRNWTKEKSGAESSVEHIQGLLHHWPVSQLVHLRFQRTSITKDSVLKLCALEKVVLIDLRNTTISGRSLASLSAKYGLASLPDNPKLLSRSSAVMAATLRGECGCRAMQVTLHPQPGKGGCTHVVSWEKAGVERLLQEASCIFGTPCSARGLQDLMTFGRYCYNTS